jgi:NAD(P)-dependent dehydrogenase (short-subunit alcohol dehydrogenase family)
MVAKQARLAKFSDIAGCKSWSPTSLANQTTGTLTSDWTDTERGIIVANSTKTAIITGASQGIGAGLVKAFVQRGYNVVANSRNISKSTEIVGSSNVAIVDGDIGTVATAEKIAATAISQFGSIDVLVNNAGFFIPKPFTEYTLDDFNNFVSTAMGGFLHISQLAVKRMLKQKSGSIVNISTSLVDHPVANVTASLAIMTKGALNAVTRALAIEYAQQGIRINTVAAGFIDTPLHTPESHDFLRCLTPVGRLGTVKEIADAVLYLTDAGFTTGEVLHVDGGAFIG